MVNKVNIVSAIASQGGITLYTDEGKEINLAMESWKTKAIMEKVTTPLARKKTVTIDLDEYSIEKMIEVKTGGVVSFVRRKFKDFKNFFNLGQTPEIITDESGNSEPEDLGPLVDGEKETLVAVVKQPDGSTVEIPAMEKIEKQIEYAAFNDAKGFQKFLERCATVKRGHTVRELLNFMEKGDLPIADDGTIVAYKVLVKTPDPKAEIKGEFYDPHSQKVPQRVGSFVTMDEKLVDPSRRTQCSTGLHIARRAYLRHFRADIATIVKVAPEDVIAVPEREPDKMRACGYHIVALLDRAAYQLLLGNLPMTSHAPTAELLGKVIAGDHVAVLEKVIIGGAKGTNIKVELTEAGEKAATASAKKEPKTAAPAEPVKVVKALDDTEKEAAISVKDVKKAVTEAVADKNAKKEERNAKRREKRAADKAHADTKKKEKAVATPKATPAVKVVATQVPEQYRAAVKAVRDGLSQREAERKFGVSAKTIRRYLK